MKKKSPELFQLACKALERAGAHAAMARSAASHLVAAEEHGLPTHGMSPFHHRSSPSLAASPAPLPVVRTVGTCATMLIPREGAGNRSFEG